MPLFGLNGVIKFKAMKLLCINSLFIKYGTSGGAGTGLREGNVYTSNGVVVRAGKHNKDCYIISELKDYRLVERFVIIDDLSEEEIAECIGTNEDNFVTLI